MFLKVDNESSTLFLLVETWFSEAFSNEIVAPILTFRYTLYARLTDGYRLRNNHTNLFI